MQPTPPLSGGLTSGAHHGRSASATGRGSLPWRLATRPFNVAHDASELRLTRMQPRTFAQMLRARGHGLEPGLPLSHLTWQPRSFGSWSCAGHASSPRPTHDMAEVAIILGGGGAVARGGGGGGGGGECSTAIVAGTLIAGGGEASLDGGTLAPIAESACRRSNADVSAPPPMRHERVFGWRLQHPDCHVHNDASEIISALDVASGE